MTGRNQTDSGGSSDSPHALRRKGGTAKVEDVARLARVSSATVSRALNSPEQVSDELRERVLSAARTLKWVPNGAAKALASMRSRTVGVLIPTLSHQNFSAMIESMQKELAKAQYTLLLGCVEYSPELRVQQARKMIEQGIECLVLVGETHPPELLELLALHEIRHVITYTSRASGSYVGFDNYEASRRITRHLTELGHRDFAMLVHAQADNDRIEQRIAGTRDALAEIGVAIRPELIARVDGRLIASAREGFGRIMASGKIRPTALICTNDYIASGAVIEARASGVRIPLDLSVVGFDDIDTAAHLDPPLTTIRVPAGAMGTEIARYILEGLVRGRWGDSVELPTELVLRGSTAPPRGSVPA